MDFSSFYDVILADVERDMQVGLQCSDGPAESLAIGRGLRGLQPRSFVILRKGRQADFLKCIDFGIDVVSARVVAILEALGATGCSFFPADIEGADGREKYFGLAVSSKSGPHIEALSRSACLVKRGRRGEVWSASYGLFFDPSTWDGSDIFFLGNGATLVVHRRVVDALAEHGVMATFADRLDLAESVMHQTVDLRQAAP